MDKEKYLFKSITLKTSKLSELIHFYKNVLDLKIIEQEEGYFEVKMGKTELRFEEYHEEAQYHFAINIPENQIEEALIWLKGRVQIDQLDDKDIVEFPNWNAHSIYFSDPAGNILEFIARHNLKNASLKEFNENSFLEISEIGVVAEDLRKLNDQIVDFLNFDIYWGELDSFAAIGHEECLLICVNPNRPWYPLNIIQSKKWPLEIIFQNDNFGQRIFFSENEYKFLE